MQGGPPPFVVCPRCGTVLLGGRGYCPRCGLGIGLAAYTGIPRYAGAPAYPGIPGYAVRTPMPPVDPAVWYGAQRAKKRWRRTRVGLLITALGLILVWLPWLSIIGALLISLGSSLLFLGARAGSRPHQVAVTLSFLAFAVGAIVIVFLLGAFLLRAFQIAGRAPMAALQADASMLQWGSLPGTAAIALGLALQVNFLLALRERVVLYGLAVLLIVTAYGATALAEPEIAALDATIVRTGPVLDFLSRLSLYRIVEAPAYLGLAVVYLFAHRSTLDHVVWREAAPVTNAP